jgi:hypothetical protein
MQVDVPASAPNDRSLAKYGARRIYFLFASAHKTVLKGQLCNVATYDPGLGPSYFLESKYATIALAWP